MWSRDGQEILFISNRGRIHGTGGFWRIKAEPGAEPREIHYEETNWKARPDLSPDGKRIVYASYLGQSWHQLWLMPANGGDVLESRTDRTTISIRVGRLTVNKSPSFQIGMAIFFVSNT